MILYNYQCLDCTHEFEDFAELSDKSLKSCPKCGTLRATKALSSKMHFSGLPTPRFHNRDSMSCSTTNTPKFHGVK